MPSSPSLQDRFKYFSAVESLSYGTAQDQEEVTEVLAALKLPIGERGRRRAAVRHVWQAAHDKPLDVGDVLA